MGKEKKIMGYIKHHAIIVTSWDVKQVEIAHTKAIEIFEKCFSNEPFQKPYGSGLVGGIIHYLPNSGCSFFIAPDGSHEEYGTSQNGNKARKEFLEYLSSTDLEYIEIKFGGDDDVEKITSSSNLKINE